MNIENNLDSATCDQIYVNFYVKITDRKNIESRQRIFQNILYIMIIALVFISIHKTYRLRRIALDTNLSPFQRDRSLKHGASE